MGYHQTPPGSVICLVRTSYCSPLATLLFFYLCCFPSPCARTICTLFGRNRRRAHGPCSKRIYTCPCTLPSPISTSCLNGLGKPLFCISYFTNQYLSQWASFYAFDFVSASCAPPPPTLSSPSPPPSPFAVSSLVSTTGSIYKSLAPMVQPVSLLAAHAVVHLTHLVC